MGTRYRAQGCRDGASTLTLILTAGILFAFAHCPRSSVDRALASEARGRAFESPRARHFKSLLSLDYAVHFRAFDTIGGLRFYLCFTYPFKVCLNIAPPLPSTGVPL